MKSSNLVYPNIRKQDLLDVTVVAHALTLYAAELAKELSLVTGESITTAVTEALREKLIRLRSVRSVSLSDQLLAIGKSCA